MPECKPTWENESYEHYSYGNCMYLAAAIHRLLGWEIQAAVTRCIAPAKPYIDHAWVVDPSGVLCLDSDGLYDINKNGFITQYIDHNKGLSESDLKAITQNSGSGGLSDSEWNKNVEKAIAVVVEYFPIKTILEKTLEISGKREADITTLPTLYHGTSRRQWRSRHGEPSYLNLTSSLSDARNYAEGWAESENEQYGNCHPIVLQIDPKALAKLLEKPGIELQPDWGWVEGQEHDAQKNGGEFKPGDETWQNSLEKCGCIGIDGFEDKFKRLFKNAEDLEADITP